MAGGKHGALVPCMVCIGEGRITKARRTREGVETDQYRCTRWIIWGHSFGMTYPNGPAEEPQWPPPKELVEAVARDT